MSKFEVVCPYCKEPNTVEKSSFVDRYGLQNINCSHCSKSWAGNLSETGRLAKSTPAASTELPALRVQVRAQMDELLKKINGLIERRAAASGPARFNTSGVEKADVAAQELEKALANGKPVTFETEASTSARFQTVESIASGVRTARGTGARFIPDGFEKNDVAAEELKKALARPIRIG